jgi:hypothetical protein
MSDYFLVKRDTHNFKGLTLVKYEAITYSGNCYLVSNVNDTLNREWLMYYDLYKLVDKKDNNYHNWYYNEEYDTKMRELISKL